MSGGLSYVPGTTDANKQYTFTRAKNFDVYLGQNITLTDVVSGPGDATGKVVDIDLDEITLEFASATTFVAVTSALTGTFSSTGTALTGTGSDLGTEAAGPFYLYDSGSGEYRQLVDTESDTAGTLRTAFTVALSADSLSIVACDVTGVPSQQHHLVLSGSGLTRISLKGIEWGLDYVTSPLSASESIMDYVTVGSVYPRGVKGATFEAASNNHTLIGAIPRNHRCIGAYVRLTANWTSASTLDLRHTTSAGSNIASIGTLGAITSGTILSFGAPPTRSTAASTELQLVSGANPSAGTANAVMFLTVDGIPNSLTL